MRSLAELLPQYEKLAKDRTAFKQKWISAGFTDVNNILLLDPSLSPAAKAMVAIILLHAFQKGSCFPPNWMLCAEMNLSEPQIIKYKKELINYGILSVTRTGRNNLYEIDFDILGSRVEIIVKNLEDAKERYEKFVNEKRTRRNNHL